MSPAPEPPPESAPSPAGKKLHGLWRVMAQTADPAEPPAPAEAPPLPAEPPPPDEPPRPAPRGLWAVMGEAAPPAAAPTEATAEPAAKPVYEITDWEADGDAVELELTDDEDEDDASPAARPAAVPEPEPVPLAPVVAAAPASPAAARNVGLCLALGAAAVPLAALALLPGIWYGLPAAGCGFGALIAGYAVWTDARQPGSLRLRASLGAGLGLIGLFLGPAVFTPWGNELRDSKSVRSTQRHLRQIGVALGQYQRDRGAFPIGGTVIVDAGGRERGGHGWMTALLPYIGQEALYGRIRLDLPCEAPENRPALSTPVEAFYAAGGSREPVVGLAVTHFAGVGGSLKTKQGATVPAGVFERTQAVSAADVTDGLAQTLAAGEIGNRYPPWGDPENWRTFGKGLNRDPRGFGNAAGDGAMLLFADGGVRFFANATDPELLERLSTRNAADPVTGAGR